VDIEMVIDLPSDGPKFESHQLTGSSSWLSHNKIGLERIVEASNT